MPADMLMFKDALVLGAGSAGLMMALAVRKQLPHVKVRVLRSPEIGVIGVGESTTPNVPRFLFDYVGLDRRKFHAMAEPTWKLGIHFLWGPRSSFDYPFQQQMDVRYPNLARPNGYYCDDDFSAMGLESALMLEAKAFARRPGNVPDFDSGHAFHLENAKLVATLDAAAQLAGIEFIDGTVTGVQRGPLGIAAVVLEDGRTVAADFFVDASGFRRELIGRELSEPFVGFGDSLFNDRALLGSWQRGPDEPILPYTTVETMDSGWAWRIDHEHVINRGYVYSSAHISDEQARAEFAAKNPRAKINDRIVRYNTGRFQRCWVDNVIAVGNSCGFVEPLEATALMMICWQCESFCTMVKDAGYTEGNRKVYNHLCALAWDEIRDFLSLHFKTNTRLDTPYWTHCRQETQSPGLAAILEYYQDTGPSGFNRYNLANHESQFGMEGYLVQLIGNKVPYRNRHSPTDSELRFVSVLREKNRAAARTGYTVKECLGFIRHPQWKWFYEQAPASKSS